MKKMFRLCWVCGIWNATDSERSSRLQLLLQHVRKRLQSSVLLEKVLNNVDLEFSFSHLRLNWISWTLLVFFLLSLQSSSTSMRWCAEQYKSSETRIENSSLIKTSTFIDQLFSWFNRKVKFYQHLTNIRNMWRNLGMTYWANWLNKPIGRIVGINR